MHISISVTAAAGLAPRRSLVAYQRRKSSSSTMDGASLRISSSQYSGVPQRFAISSSCSTCVARF
jgi:hypothetical protein